MSKVYYIGYYDIPENKELKRSAPLAAVTKMGYIASSMARAGYEVEIVSCAAPHVCKSEKGGRIRLSDGIALTLFSSLPWGNRVRRVMARTFIKLQFACYVLKNVRRDDRVVVYHSTAYMRLIRFLKKLRGFELIAEIEEIYGDVLEKERVVRTEMRFFRIADRYIFPNHLLGKKINTEGKPQVVIHGTYNCEKDRSAVFADNGARERVHIVYAGTFDPRKGGVMAAISAAEHLSGKYHVHIIGFGTQEQTKAVCDAVDEASRKSSCVISYDGLYTGEEYIDFLQKCHIGLSTQNPAARFNDTSFPSKILSYMSNGLRVVSIDIPAVRTADIGEHVYYYTEQTGVGIADAIKGIDFSDGYDGRAVLEKLDERFVAEIDALLRKA